MLLSINHIDELTNKLFNSFLYINIILILAIIIFGDYSSVNNLITIITFIFCTSLLSRKNEYKRNNFSLLFSLYSTIYICIPLTFIGIKGKNYEFGSGVVEFYNQNTYIESLNFSIIFLLILWISVWLGLILTVRYSEYKIIQWQGYKLISLNRIWMLFIIVILVSITDTLNFYNIKGNNLEVTNNVLSLIFGDKVFIYLIAVIVVFKIQNLDVNNRKKYLYILSLVILYSVIINSLGGSKAGILVAITLAIFLPLSLSLNENFKYFPFFKVKVIVLLFVALPILFYVVNIFRYFIVTGQSFNVSNLYLIAEYGSESLEEIFESMFYRLSWGGFDRYHIIFQSFIIDYYDINYSLDFLNYIVKNTINLLLPGTIFPESFVMSAQLFPLVINKDILLGLLSPEELYNSFNTQAYSIFGIFIIIFGFFSPLLLFIFIIFTSYLYRKFSNILFRLALIVFFQHLLSSYGFEVNIGNTFLFLISIIFMLIFLCPKLIRNSL